MWEESNSLIGSQRVINRYIRQHFGRNLLAKEGDLRASSARYFPPTTDSFLLDGKKKNYWYKAVDKYLINQLNKQFKPEDFKDAELVDLVIGGDHGKGRFRMLCRIMIRTKQKKTLKTLIFNGGQIDCATDSTRVLMDSLSIPIAQSMERIAGSFNGTCVRTRRTR
jgi:hypothetical protein